MSAIGKNWVIQVMQNKFVVIKTLIYPFKSKFSNENMNFDNLKES